MDIQIHDTIQADQIENGDQIRVDGDPLENVKVLDDPHTDGIIVKGWSNETGDIAEYVLPYDYSVDVWAL